MKLDYTLREIFYTNGFDSTPPELQWAIIGYVLSQISYKANEGAWRDAFNLLLIKYLIE